MLSWFERMQHIRYCMQRIYCILVRERTAPPASSEFSLYLDILRAGGVEIDSFVCEKQRDLADKFKIVRQIRYITVNTLQN